MRPRTLTLICTFALAAVAAPVPAQSPLAPDERGILTIAPVIERMTGAVVNIAAEVEQPANLAPSLRDPRLDDFFGLPEELPGLRRDSVGSGVIVDADLGYVLTNHHVVVGADTIRVTLRDGRELDAELVGSDSGTDIAVLRIPAEDLVGLPLGDSERLRVGDFVVAVGNPFGIGQTVTAGIVSALGRAGVNPQGYEDFIQTDASINPGNSGGALATLDGRLVGINTAIVSRTGGNIGIGFAVPIDMAQAVMDQIIEYGEVRRGQLGVTIRDLTADLAQALGVPVERGAVVIEVVQGSAAEEIGLSPGDVITVVDGMAVEGSRDLRNRIGTLRPGEEVELTVQRGVEVMTRVATLERAAAETAAEGSVPVPPGTTSPALAGAFVTDLEAGHPAHGQVNGVVVSSVEPDSDAAAAGLETGDVITEVNRAPVPSKAEFDARMAAATQTVALTVWRDGREILLVVTRAA